MGGLSLDALPRAVLVAGVTTFIGFMSWNLTLNATRAVPNFNVDAPVIPLSWADAGSGVFACLVTALVPGLLTDRHEPAHQVLSAFVSIVLDLFVL